MNPTTSQLLLVSFIVASLVLVVLFNVIKKQDRQVAENNRKVAKDAVQGMIKEIGSPNRHRWVPTPQGEAIQFIYLLLGRQSIDPKTGHLVWAEVTVLREGAHVNIYHVPSIEPDDDYLVATVDALLQNGWVVNVVKTDGQPNLENTGVRRSEISV